jgi:ABC-type enterobactin transport system permease subunit
LQSHIAKQLAATATVAESIVASIGELLLKSADTLATALVVSTARSITVEY